MYGPTNEQMILLAAAIFLAGFLSGAFLVWIF